MLYSRFIPSAAKDGMWSMFVGRVKIAEIIFKGMRCTVKTRKLTRQESSSLSAFKRIILGN